MGKVDLDCLEKRRRKGNRFCWREIWRTREDLWVSLSKVKRSKDWGGRMADLSISLWGFVVTKKNDKFAL